MGRRFTFSYLENQTKNSDRLGFIEGLVGWRCEIRLSSKRGLSRLFMSRGENPDKTKVCTGLTAQRAAHVSRLMVNWVLEETDPCSAISAL